MSTLKFPKSFLWGGAASAEQTEGKGITPKSKTIWDLMHEKDPSAFYNGVGPAITNDMTRRYKEDLVMLKQLNFNSYRTGFSWARLFNEDLTINKEGVKFYHDYIDEMHKNGLTVMMGLYHFDLPAFIQSKGGFESRFFVDQYEKLADFVFGEYGSKVDYFITHNEPIVPVLASYVKGMYWPYKRDMKLAIQAGFHTILSHARAVKVFNTKYRNKIKAKIGVICNVSPALPKDGKNFSEADKQAADNFNLLHNYSMLDPMILGKFPKELVEIVKERKIIPTYEAQDLVDIANTKIDFVGVNFYFPTRVRAIEPTDSVNKNDLFDQFYKDYKWPEARMNVFRGWEIYPQILTEIGSIMKNRYHNLPWYISESGMGVQNEHIYRDAKTGEIADDYRISFINEHLLYLNKAIESGSNCFGYHMWAPIDNWSWLNAYKNRYGYIEMDVATQKRTFKKSAHWIKDIAKNNAISSEFIPVEKVIDLKNAKFEPSKTLDEDTLKRAK